MKKSLNTTFHKASVSKQKQNKLKSHKSIVIWFTGISGSGKSTLAHSIAMELYKKNCHVTVLDGDNIRHGLCNDLGFTKDDRVENIRRVGELSKLFMEAGIITLAAFISPFENDRKKLKKMFLKNEFVEVYVKCDLEVCESRDVKGIYSKARSGEIRDFTGIDSPYEEPLNPNIIIDTNKINIRDSVNTILDYIYDKKIIQKGTNVL